MACCIRTCGPQKPMISPFSGWAMLKVARVVRPGARNLLTCTQSQKCVKKHRPISCWPLPRDPDAALLPGGVGRFGRADLAAGPARVCGSIPRVLRWQRGVCTMRKVITVSKGSRGSLATSSNLTQSLRLLGTFRDHGLNLGHEFHSIFPQTVCPQCTVGIKSKG